MKNIATEEIEPNKEPGKERVQRVVEAYVDNPDDKQKRLAAIEEALKLNAKAGRRETEKTTVESRPENARLSAPIEQKANAELPEDHVMHLSLLEQLRKQAKEASRYKSKGLDWLIKRD